MEERPEAVSDVVPKALILPAASVGRELATFVETGLMTVDQQKALTVATQNLQVMKQVSTPAAGRHFNRIDTMLAVRMPSPVSQAREVLSTLATTWESMSGDFHKFRELYYEARLRRAKANQKRKLLDDPDLTEDDRTILSAELDLEGAKIDKIEAEVGKGQAALQGQVAKATAASDQYAALLTSSGKAEFTEDDFRAEETDYYLQSAWWHASQVFSVADMRNKWNRPKGEATHPDQDAARKREERLYRRVNVKHEIVLYFQGLGISQPEIEAELAALLGQRESFDMANETMSGNSNPQSFAGHFEGWIKRTALKYRDRAVTAIGKDYDRIKRIAAIIDPGQEDKGSGGDVKDLGRRGMTE